MSAFVVGIVCLLAGMLFQNMLWQFVCYLSHGIAGRCLVDWIDSNIRGLKSEAMHTLAKHVRERIESKPIAEEVATMFERLAKIVGSEP